MNNSMAEANLVIINELKKFMQETISTGAQRMQYCTSAKDFSRNRVLTFTCVVMLIVQALKRSLSIEIQDFFDHYYPGSICSKQAFSAQRTKLKPSFFQSWNRILIHGFYQHYGTAIKTWKGHRLWAIDGSTLLLPETGELQTLYGCSGNQHGQQAPLARICLIYDVLNSLIIEGMLHPFFTSEASGCIACLEKHSTANTVLLFDRAYPSYWLMYLLMQKDAHFIMRIQKHNFKAVCDFIQSGSMDQTVCLYPTYPSLKRLNAQGVTLDKDTPIRIRMVKIVLDTGETEVLVTNLYDSHLYALSDMKQVYNFRWGIETGYGYLKEELQLGQFSGIRSICILQDFAANLFVFNLQSLIEKQSEPYLDVINQKRKRCYKVNKNVSWGSLKYRVVKLFLEDDCFETLCQLERLFCRHLVPIRPGRKYCRVKIDRPKCKYYTLTNYKRAI